MAGTVLGIKVDVDTYRGLKTGVPNLLAIFRRCAVRAGFYVSLGPDNSGKAIRRVFTRKGFLQKMLRTRAVSMYGFKTVLYGTLLPAPVMGEKLPHVIRSVRDAGHEIGIHAWDHVKWHDRLDAMTSEEIEGEFQQAARMFEAILGYRATASAAAAWRANAWSLEMLDRQGLLYHSDSRGTHPYFPRIGERVFSTLEIPTTLPTADEILGTPGVDATTLADALLEKIVPGRLNIFTMHAEVEGMGYQAPFERFLQDAMSRGVRCETLETIAREALCDKDKIPVCDLIPGTVPGRSGEVAVQRTG